MSITINTGKPEMKTKTLTISFEKGSHEPYYAIVDGLFIIPLDKVIRERYVRHLRGQGHEVIVLPDIRMVAAETMRVPVARKPLLNQEQLSILDQILAGDHVDAEDVEPLVKWLHDEAA